MQFWRRSTNLVRQRRLPPRYAPYLYGAIQATITTGIATAIALHVWTDFDLTHLSDWLLSWGAAWLLIMPFVLFCSPMIQKAVLSLTERHDDTRER